MQRLDDLLLAGHDGWVVQRDVVDADAKRRSPADSLKESRAFKPSLCRNATAVQACTADFIAFDERCCQAQLRRAYGGSVPAVSTPYDYEIELDHYLPCASYQRRYSSFQL